MEERKKQMKTFMKRALWTLLLLTVAAAMAVCASAANEIDSGKCGENLTWTLYDDGEMVIDGQWSMSNYSSNNAPWNAYKANIRTLTIKDGVESIGSSAFQDCSLLSTINFGNGLTSIGQSAFRNCDALKGITIPDTVNSIGS
ncbi:MAG: leucine-rich repeat domain-containing protein, partial [Ruminococcaceae bacterium]|nr:leucine-rich repeat domain-containing protein [Oscillospiraceae bacterium]